MSRSTIFSIFLLVLLLGYMSSTNAFAKAVRLGWQIPWATQGQLVMALKYTNIPLLVDLDLEFSGFAYGAPLNHAALAGEVDVLLTADQPALVLMSRSPDYFIVGRMMYNRVCIYVPPKSPILTLGDLRGKTIMGPVGAAAERVALKALADAGLSQGTFRAGSLGMQQQTSVVRQNDAEWDGVDALYGFDPLPAIFEAQGRVRVLACDKVVSLVVASRQMIEARSADLEKFMAAFHLSWFYFASHPEILDAWFAGESRLAADSEILRRVASVEPNRFVKSLDEIRLILNQADYETLAEAQAFLRERNIIGRQVDVPSRVKLGALQNASETYPLNQLYKQVHPVRSDAN